ncbi:SgrR family transcriptional regulator [Chitinimonas sp.]|uniref:SgrR family transcriptional regulator n=1 Tax=Chitinimonas sp. TaxID=1934313 RepID=UPI0035B2EA0A
MRLLDQFQRLADGLSAHAAPSLAEIAGMLCCSERNARLLLQRMQAEGWLRWEPGRGRGHRSRLTVLQAPAALRLGRLHRLLEQGRLEAAFEGLPSEGQAQLLQALPGYLGVSRAGGLRLPFYRPLHALDPIQVNRRTEAHMLAQICAGLTEFDAERKSVVPALAHHWESGEGGRQWDFWLRPGLTFHDGRPVQAEDAAQSLRRLRDSEGPFRAMFSHLQQIDSHGAQLSLRLAAPDYLLLNRLAHHAASVLPAQDWLRPDFARLPIGAGPFRLLRNNDYRATFAAFTGYFRERALLDEIDIWVVPVGAPLPEVDISHSYRHLPEGHWQSLQQLEQGCDYIAFNPTRPAFARAADRVALAAWLREAVQPMAAAENRPMAEGFLPGWQQLPAVSVPLPDLPGTLDVVTYQLDGHIALANCLARRLAERDVQARVTVLSYPEFAQAQWRDWADIMVCGEVMHEDIELDLYACLNGASLFHGWFDGASRQLVDAACARVAAEPRAARRLAFLQDCFADLLQCGALAPISHIRQGMHFAPHLGGVRLAACGWMDFRRLWLRESPDSLAAP